MKTVHKIVRNLINENIFHLKVSSFRQDRRYLGKTNLYGNTHFTILQYTFSIGWNYTC